MPLQGDIDYKLLVSKTNGFSGAEMVAICTDAALVAIDEEKMFITQDHVLEAISKIKPQITREMLDFYENFKRKNPN